MKEQKQSILNEEVVITTENVKQIGEIIALKTIKTVMTHSGKDIFLLYKGLIKDMNKSPDSLEPFSDGYDIAQTAILFLYEHLGKKLGDSYITKHGKVITIKRACYRYVDRYLGKQYTIHLTNTIPLNEVLTKDLTIYPTEEETADYKPVESLIKKMKLTQTEYETLCAYMAGMTFIDIARFMNVNSSTIWRRRESIKKKYLSLTTFN